MNSTRFTKLGVAVAAALAMPSFSALAADSVTEAKLRKMLELQAQQIAQQQQQIAEMNARLSALEGGEDETLTVLKEQVAQISAKAATTKNEVSWNSGMPTLKWEEGGFSFRPRARALIDFSSTQGSSYDGRNLNGTDFNSVRLGAEGQMGKMGYKAEVDFADNKVVIKDAYLSYSTKSDSLAAEFYAGNKMKDLGIDGSTGGTTTPFMDRNAVAAVGLMNTGFFGLGLTSKVYGDSWHASLSITGDDAGNAGVASDTITYLVRAHWNPIKRSAGFMHLGGWYWYENLGNDVASISKNPSLALGWNTQVNVMSAPVSNPTNNHAWGVELGGVWHSGWAMAETTVRTINSSTVDSYNQKASSYSVGWLVTGETSGFSSRSGSWGTTKVLNPINDGGWGAVELLARYDTIDYTDALLGGKSDAWTFGVNWYLTNWTRLMFNVIHWNTNNKQGPYQGDDSGNTLAVRAQFAF